MRSPTDPRVTKGPLAALNDYDLPDPTAARTGFACLMSNLHRLNILATYRASS